MKIVDLLTHGFIKTFIALVWIFPAPAWAAGGYVYDFIGDLNVTNGKNATHQAMKNEVIATDTVVSTGDKSYAVLKFDDGQVATMQANTTFHFSKYRYDSKLAKKNNIYFAKFNGGMRFISGQIGQLKNQALLLATPNATINIHNAEFVVATFKGSVYSQVRSGSISMTNAAGISTFKAGQTILVKTSRTLPKAIPATALPQDIFSQLDAIPAFPATIATVPESSAAATDSATSVIISDAPLDSATEAGTTGASAAMLSANIAPLAMLDGAPELSPVPSDEPPITPSTPAPALDARTISITGAGATYTGAELLCDFCTGRTQTVATHVEPATATGGAVTGDANLFSKHNLTPTGANTGEICAFCHAPQGAEDKVSAPRWNRALTTLSSYRAYASLGSATQQATGSISMACLSCHDGSQAPNIVINTPDLHLNVGDTMVTTGNDLKNHHPVGVQYGGGGQNQNAPDITPNPKASFERNSGMNSFAEGNKFSGLLFKPTTTKKFFNSGDTAAFGDVLTLSNEGTFDSNSDYDTNYDTYRGGFNKSTYSGTGSGTVWWVKSPGSKKGRQKTDLYLFTRTDTTDSTPPDESVLNRPYVECATCHDPHSGNPTFLRFPGGNARSQICLTCHNK